MEEKEPMEEKEATEDVEEMRYCPWQAPAQREADQLLCDLSDCEMFDNESDACSIKLGALALEKIAKIFEMVHPGLMQTSFSSKGSHDTLIPFALDLCESEIRDMKDMACKTYASLTTHMDRMFANLQIANIVIGRDGYGNVANKDRYRTVKATFLALQERHGLIYDNDLI